MSKHFDLHLTNEQFLDLLKRIRKDLDKIEKINAIDSTVTGLKHTIVNVGVCSGEETKGGWSKINYTTRETAMWPKDFDTIGKTEWPYPQQFAMKYRGDNHKCPLDSRSQLKAEAVGFGCGCFYYCRAFKDKNLTIGEIKKLYDEQIAKRERKKERKIHEWDVSDEHGYRIVELWEIDGELKLFATDQDGGEVEPRV